MLTPTWFDFLFRHGKSLAQGKLFGEGLGHRSPPVPKLPPWHSSPCAPRTLSGVMVTAFYKFPYRKRLPFRETFLESEVHQQPSFKTALPALDRCPVETTQVLQSSHIRTLVSFPVFVLASSDPINIFDGVQHQMRVVVVVTGCPLASGRQMDQNLQEPIVLSHAGRAPAVPYAAAVHLPLRILGPHPSGPSSSAAIQLLHPSGSPPKTRNEDCSWNRVRARSCNLAASGSGCLALRAKRPKAYCWVGAATISATDATEEFTYDHVVLIEPHLPCIIVDHGPQTQEPTGP